MHAARLAASPRGSNAIPLPKNRVAAGHDARIVAAIFMKPFALVSTFTPRFFSRLALLVTLAAAPPGRAQTVAPAPLVQFRAGDRVVLAGDPAAALARDGTFETLLQARLPELKLTLRTPDVPADKATGLPPAKELRAVLKREQAEVVFLFAGSAPASGFEAALENLCTEILAAPFSSRGAARLILVTAPAAADAASAAVRKLATQRGLPHLDLRRAVSAAVLAPPGGATNAPAPEVSAWALAHVLQRELGLALPEAALVLDADDLRFASRVGTVERTLRDGRTRRVELINVPLPSPPPPDGLAFPSLVTDPRRHVRVTKLEPGEWTLSLDGETLAAAGANEWATGLHVASRTRESQATRLREAVVKKNELFRTGALELGEADVQVWELSVASPKIVFSISPAGPPAAPGKS